METERNKFTSGTQKKGGKDVTRMVLTASGGMVVGGAAVAAIHQEEEPVVPVREEEQPIAPAPEQNQNAQDQPTQQAVTPERPSVAADEVQPVDSGSSSSSAESSTTVQNNHVNSNSQTTDNSTTNEVDPTIDDVDPTLIAEEITATEIDPNDNDMADMINVDMVDTLYLDDGSELPVAVFHTPDGGQFMMVDVNNDLTFDVVTDLEGNPILAVESNLTMSDIEDMMDDSGNMLAFNEEQNEQELAYGGNPENDIITTDLTDGDPWGDDTLASNEEPEEDGTQDEEDENDLAMEEGSDDNLNIDDIS